MSTYDILLNFSRNVTGHSMVIIDELGRGTSTRDGLAISIAIAEALIDSQAFVWFATHFRELGEFQVQALVRCY